jgi:hypothetical protein
MRLFLFIASEAVLRSRNYFLRLRLRPFRQFRLHSGSGSSAIYYMLYFFLFKIDFSEDLRIPNLEIDNHLFSSGYKIKHAQCVLFTKGEGSGSRSRKLNHDYGSGKSCGSLRLRLHNTAQRPAHGSVPYQLATNPGTDSLPCAMG